MSFGDGPPYSEDEDLHSPVFSSRHRKNKSTGTVLIGRRGKSPGGRSVPSRYFAEEPGRGMLVSMNADGSETYYVNDGDSADDGPGGEYVTYSADESRYSHLAAGEDQYANQYNYEGEPTFDSDDEDRYSRDFQFAVGCPDEEMNGKAVALFDFTREHENELPLVEGQVIFVSYRHGQGWLVAEDPKSGESGLVPEEFVRLLRDIEGGLTSLNEEDELETGQDVTENSHQMYLSPESTGQVTSAHEVPPNEQEQGQKQGQQETDNTANGEEAKKSDDSNNKQTVVVPVNEGGDGHHPSDTSHQTGTSTSTGTPVNDSNDANNDNNPSETKSEDEKHVTKT